MQMTRLGNLVMYPSYNYICVCTSNFLFQTEDNVGCEVANCLEGVHGADYVGNPIVCRSTLTLV